MPFVETSSETVFTQGEGRSTHVTGQSTTSARVTTKQGGIRRSRTTTDGVANTRTDKRDFGAEVKVRVIIMGGVTSYTGGVSPCA